MRAVVFLLLLLQCSLTASAGVQHKFFNDVRCLAAVIHHEARGESLRGKRAVYDVTKYRMKKQQKSCLEVATARKQYSGFTTNKLYKVTNNQLTEYWKIARLPAVCRECEFYHRWDVRPVWRYKLVKTAQIGNHIFYKSKERA